MKKKFTYSAVLILILSLSSLLAKSQTVINSDLSFVAIPTLESGIDKQMGAKYRFLNVATGTSAVVTIVNLIGGATLDMLDDNVITKPEAFSPRITIPAGSNGLVEFKIELFAGTSSIPKMIDTLSVTAIDIDGNGTLKEKDVLDLGAGSTLSFLSTTQEISVVRTGNEYIGTNIGGNEYPSVDTTAKQVMFTVSKGKISSFIYKAGANNTGTGAVTGRQKSIYFKGFNLPVSALPIKLLSFSGKALSQSISLNWITEKEINHSHFEVERSLTGNDFKSIAIVLDGIEDGSRKNYSLKDANVNLQSNSTFYYRLKSIDLDGKFTYSSIVAVSTNAVNNQLTTIQTYPNPFVDQLTVKLNTKVKGNVDVRITNANGQVITSKRVMVVDGFNNIQINNLSNLPKGYYVASVILDGKIIGTQNISK